MGRFNIMFLFLSLVFTCCKQEDRLPDTYIDKFYKNQSELGSLINVLKEDTFLENKYGQIFKPAQFDDATKRKLENLGIVEVHLFSWGGDQRQFDFKTNWRKVEPIHLWYNTLDSVETVKGFYRKDENSNEVWGLGNNRSLWIERKLIDGMQ